MSVDVIPQRNFFELQLAIRRLHQYEDPNRNSNGEISTIDYRGYVGLIPFINWPTLNYFDRIVSRGPNMAIATYAYREGMDLNEAGDAHSAEMNGYRTYLARFANSRRIWGEFSERLDFLIKSRDRGLARTIHDQVLSSLRIQNSFQVTVDQIRSKNDELIEIIGVQY